MRDAHLFSQAEFAEFLLDISAGFGVFAFLQSLLDGRIFVDGLVSVDDFARSGRVNDGVRGRFNIDRTFFVQFVSGSCCQFSVFICFASKFRTAEYYQTKKGNVLPATARWREASCVDVAAVSVVVAVEDDSHFHEPSGWAWTTANRSRHERNLIF